MLLLSFVAVFICCWAGVALSTGNFLLFSTGGVGFMMMGVLEFFCCVVDPVVLLRYLAVL